MTHGAETYISRYFQVSKLACCLPEKLDSGCGNVVDVSSKQLVRGTFAPGSCGPNSDLVNTELMSISVFAGGNAKTLMFVNASPADTNVDETHNSLIYATRVRSIINTATKNIESKEILRLKKQIAHWKEQAGKKGEEEDLDEIEDKKSTVSVGPE